MLIFYSIPDFAPAKNYFIFGQKTMQIHPMKTEFQIVADIFDNGRQMFKYFLAKVPEEHLHTRLEMNGKKMNSAYWIACHAIWAENSLLLAATSGPLPYLPYLDKFALGQSTDEAEETLDWQEITEMMELVHRTAMTWLQGRPDSELDDEISDLRGKPSTFRISIYHAIRHEGVHSGQLAWIAAALGAETP